MSSFHLSTGPKEESWWGGGFAKRDWGIKKLFSYFTQLYIYIYIYMYIYKYIYIYIYIERERVYI